MAKRKRTIAGMRTEDPLQSAIDMKTKAMRERFESMVIATLPQSYTKAELNYTMPYRGYVAMASATTHWNETPPFPRGDAIRRLCVCRWCGEPLVLDASGIRCNGCNGPVEGGIYG